MTSSVQAMRHHILVWKIFGLWDIDGNPIWYRCYKFLLCTIFYIAYPGCIALKLLSTSNFDEVIDILLILPSAFAGSKAFVIAVKRRQLDKLLILMHDMDELIEHDDHRRILDEQVTGSIVLVKVLGGIYCSTVIFSFIGTLLADQRRLMWQSYYPFFDWENNTAVFYFFLMFQLACTFSVALIYSSLDVHASAMYKVLCAHIDILGDKLRRLGSMQEEMMLSLEGQTRMDSHVAFRQCITYHNYCLRYMAYINDILSMHFLVQFGISGLVFCGSEFKISVLSPTENFRDFLFIAMYIVSMTYQLSIPCYFGSIVNAKSQQLLGNVFESNWMDQSKEFKLSMSIFGELAKKPITPYAAGLFAVSLPTFVSIMRSAYSLMACLKTMDTN